MSVRMPATDSSFGEPTQSPGRGALNPMSVRPKRSFDREFKLQVVRQLIQGEKRLSQLCREHSLSPSLVARWRAQYEQEGENAFAEALSPMVERDAERRIAELEAALGRAHLEIELLRRAVKKGGLRSGRNEP